MQTERTFLDCFNRPTTFVHTDSGFWMACLCGLECGTNGLDTGPARARNLLALESDIGRLDPDEICLDSCSFDSTGLEARWSLGVTGLAWHTIWKLNVATGIWSRRDILMNQGQTDRRLTRLLARFPFAPSHLRIYAQNSNWAHENQGRWIDLTTGELILRSQAGRTNQGNSPYLFLCPQGSSAGIAFHVIPRGDWVIHLDHSLNAGNPGQPYTILEMGLSDDLLSLLLPGGASFELPEILVQSVPASTPELGASYLHAFTLEHIFPSSHNTKPYAPLVYNTWFDAFEALELERLHDQLAAASQVGCEVFVVDAGWYGNGIGPWDRQVGDWTEKRSGAFQGHMAAFAEQVRSAGLGFGLWMEPERLASGVPPLSAHPEWFLPCPWDYFHPDLSQAPVREYLLGEISRLVETYQLAWLKVDFNLEMGNSLDSFSRHYLEWYKMLDKLRSLYPNTFFEGCASGGMRMDLNTLAHLDGHFLSDNVNPLDVLRITQGALLRLPPGRTTRWAVMRPADRLAPRYSLPIVQSPERVIAPGSNGWEDAFIADIDFICRVALPGMFGYSGDLAGLPGETLRRLQHHSSFYKRWRAFLTGSICYLLTPVMELIDQSGWVAFQLQAPDHQGVNLVFVYRLEDGMSKKTFPLHGLAPGQNYTVLQDDNPDLPTVCSGRELSCTGLVTNLPSKFTAGIYIVEPIPV